MTLSKRSEVNSAVAPELLLSLRAVTKSFGEIRVLDRVSFNVARGEAVALLGHNGSGKSTLINILAGFHQPDRGTALTPAGEMELGSFRAAHDAGMRFVHQHLGLVGSLNVVDNFALGGDYPRNRMGAIRWSAARERARSSIASLGVDIDLSMPVERLSPVERTIVAIARALRDFPDRARLLVLDEPTATMSAADARFLFPTLDLLRESGVGIIYVTHHLDEVSKVADRAVVLRGGKLVGEASGEDLGHDRLVELILGQDHAHEHLDVPSVPVDAPVILRVDGLNAGPLRPTSFALRHGEIVGLAGVTGSGREHVVSALVGAIPRGGSVTIDGVALKGGDPGAAARVGLVSVPADRPHRAVIPAFSSGRNLTLGSISRHSRGPFIDARSERTDMRTWMDRLAVLPPDPNVAMTSLSGGNQQKVSIGRSLRRNPRVLAVDEPTQGVDVGARSHIYRLIGEAASAGAVIVASSDAEELAAICTRVLVLVRGRVRTELAGTISPADIDRAVLGSTSEDEK